MASNGISTLPTKEERQLAKLELAQTKRQQVGTQGYRDLRYLDITELPTVYSGNAVVNQPNVGGLIQGRPWKTTPNILSGLYRTAQPGYWGGDTTWFDNNPSELSIPVADFTLAPVGSAPNNSFQWLGYFRAPHSANYTFYMYSDDEAAFWIGDKAITAYSSDNTDLFTSAPSGELSTVPIALTAGEYYPIRIQYGNNMGDGYFNFSWSDDQDITTTGMVLWLQTWSGWPYPWDGLTWTNKLDGDFPGMFNASTLNHPDEADLGGAPIMLFNGTTNYWDVTNPTTGDFTVGVWFQTTSTVGTGTYFYDNPQLVGSDSAGVANDWGFCIKNGQIGFGGVSGQTAFTTEQFNDGNWHYAIATRVKTTGAMTVFVDGVQLAQITEAPGAELTDTPTIRIGGDPTNNAFYQGYMAEVQFYQIALTPDQVASNFLIQRGTYGV